MIHGMTDDRRNTKNSLGNDSKRRAQSRRIYVRRKQEVKRQLLLLGVIAVLIILSIVSGTRNFVMERKAQETSAVKTEKKVNGPEPAKEQQEEADLSEKNDEGVQTEEEYLARVKKEAKKAGYPKEIIKLLSKNPETADFVADYGAKKDIAPAKTIGEVKKGKIPHLLQWDERWGYSAYGTSTIAVSGCGPTCMAMVVSGLNGDKSVTPARVAAYSMKHKYIDEANDTVWLFMQEAAKHWGITGYEITSDESLVEEELASGHPIICSMGKGDFTKNGHFIVLVGYEDGKVKVNDPFSRKNSEKMWKYKDIKGQIRALWAYSR